jgi:hypothetical protein
MSYYVEDLLFLNAIVKAHQFEWFFMVLLRATPSHWCIDQKLDKSQPLKL